MRRLIIPFLVLASVSQVAFSKPKNISFISERMTNQTLDLGTTGASMGDITVNTGNLLDAKTNATIGTYISRKTMIVTNGLNGTDTRDTSTQYDLPQGTVSMTDMSTYTTGNSFPAMPQERAIVGGTGKYSGAKGVAVITPMTNRPGALYVTLKFE